MKEPLRILYVHHTAEWGGAERSLADMIAWMDREAVRPALLVPKDGPLAEELHRIGVDVYFGAVEGFSMTRNPARLALSALMAARGARAVARTALAHGARIIHANSLKVAPYLVFAGRPGGVRTVLHVRDMVSSRRIARALCGRFDMAIPISKAVAEFYGLEGAPVVHSGVDFRRFDRGNSGSVLRATASIPKESSVIGMAAQMVRWKNHGDFLRAASVIASRFPNARFVIAGGGRKESSYESGLQKLAGELGIAEKTAFLGWCDDMPEFYAALDVLVHPATREPFGRVLPEAMGCGVPVAAYCSGGPAEIVDDGRTGLLAPAGDWKSLASCVCRLLDEKDLKDRISETARKEARSRFSAEFTALRVMDLYLEVTS